MKRILCLLPALISIVAFGEEPLFFLQEMQVAKKETVDPKGKESEDFLFFSDGNSSFPWAEENALSDEFCFYIEKQVQGVSPQIPKRASKHAETSLEKERVPSLEGVPSRSNSLSNPVMEKRESPPKAISEKQVRPKPRSRPKARPHVKRSEASSHSGKRPS